MGKLALTFFFVLANYTIMNIAKYPLQTLVEFFSKHRIATIDEVRESMGNPARTTVFRKLGELEYLSSYSHRGRYYTLKSVARFSGNGLWSFKSVWFSRYGNLLDTAEALVHDSRAGHTALEMDDIVHVKSRHALIGLVRQGRLQREKIGRHYVYLSSDGRTAEQQRKERGSHGKTSFASVIVKNPKLAEKEAKAALLLFCSILDEKQRRLYAGLESLKLGHGGDIHIASLLGMDPHTVARGRQELMGGQIDNDGIRTGGGGRLPQEKKLRKS
jgi:hypothetical protein